MTRARRRSGARSRGPVPTGAAAVLVMAMVVASAAVLIGRHLDALAAEKQAASAAARAVTEVADALESKSKEASALSSGGGQGAEPSADVAASSETLARDTGQPVLDESGVAVVALYDTGAAPGTVQERRDHVTGYLAVPLDLAVALRPLLPTEGGLSLSGPTRTVISIPETGPGKAASFTVPFGPDLASGWSLTAWTTPTRTPGSAWLIALCLLAAGVAFAGWLTARQREERRRQEELEGLQETSSTVAVLATLAQQSLDLGEALPGVTTELAGILGLSGLSVTAPNSAGESPIFVWGAPQAEGETYRGQQRLAAGQTLALVLAQGGRTVARMRVTAGRDLGKHEMRTLLAASDVLTAALANAEAFTQQEELIARMRAVDELKSAFLATASHELRTPVAAITGYASLLHTNWDQLAPEESRNFAQRLDAVAQRLSRLVEEILDFSRLESGNGSAVTASELDLAETVAQVLEEQSELAPEHRIDYRPEPGLRVIGARAAVERVLMNLVGNAAKYSEAGSTIRILVRGVDGAAELVVEDEGPGIPAAERGQIFAPFYRGQGKEVIRTRGAGLGLAIAAEFAASMGGKIRVEEAAGGGASFVATYPLAPLDAVTDPGAAHVQA